MDGALSNILSGLASRFLDQDQDLAFSFSGAVGSFSVISFSAQEVINAPFEVHIELASDDPAIDLHALMDQSGTLGIHSKYDVPRYLNGIVTDVERRDSGIRRTFYSVTLRPMLSRLDHSTDSRHWQAKTVPDIVKEVLEEFAVTDVDWRFEGDHQSREFLVQYRETQRAFIERIMAEEGIFYFFEHSASSHKMVITDAPLATPMIPAAPEIGYNPRPGGQSRGSWISTFHQRERLRSSAYQMNDYTFKNPPANMKQRHTAQEENGLSSEYALYDYPGRYKDPNAAGDPFTKHRIESVRVDATTANGVTNNIQLFPGVHFALTGHDDPKANCTHRLLSVSHSGTQPAALEEDAGSGPTTYSSSFTCQPARLPYRPPIMRKPMVDGPQIAIVTGPAGEEIYCDEHGRIKVWFPWDRYSAKDENSSCWIRVSQNWAGGTWGHIAIPRIGHEVIVEFLEGDPDQPIITGRTYHASNKSPYPLPDHKTKMVIRSDSHKGTGFNELSFEDEAGQENIALHAQKDQTLKVLNNRMKRVDNDQIESVGSNKSIDIGNNHQEKIGGSMNLFVGGGKASALAGSLAGISGMAQQASEKSANAMSNPFVSEFISGTTDGGSAGEALSLLQNNLFDAASRNRAVAGLEQLTHGAAVGALLSKVMPASGIKNTIVEKAVLDTIGVTRTEQVGMFKNTTVGHTQVTTVQDTQKNIIGNERHSEVGKIDTQKVGEHLNVLVGNTYSLTVGKSSITLHKDGTIRLRGTRIELDGQNSIRANSAIIDLN